jgi:hypothetical protein
MKIYFLDVYMTLLEYVYKIRASYMQTASNIKVVSYKELPELTELIDHFLHTVQKELIPNRCHVIAMMLAQKYPDQIAYVEGYASSRWLTTEIMLPIQHAWNKWHNYYFDLSAEVVSQTFFNEYVMLTEAYLQDIDNHPEHPLMQDSLLFGYHLLHTLQLWD